nr:MAG TPA: hypothetical protein [Caudoviricetes sp.]
MAYQDTTKSSCLKGWLLYFIEINWYNINRLC